MGSTRSKIRMNFVDILCIFMQLFFCMRFAEFLPCARYQDQVYQCDNTCDQVRYVQRQTKTDGLAQQEGRNDEDIECTRQQRDEERIFGSAFLCTKVNCDCCEREYCDCLVCPCEVSPQDVEAFCIQFREYQNSDNGDEDTQCYHDTISFFFLVDVQVVSNHQTAGTQCGITGSASLSERYIKFRFLQK